MTGSLHRRTFLTGLAAASLLPSGATAQDAVPSDINFTVRIAGEPVGHHRLRFRREADGLRVDVDVAIKVRIFFVTVFDYRQTASELWRDGRLVSFTSETMDGDNLDRVRAKATADGKIAVESLRFGDRTLDGDLWPSTAFWRPAAVRRDVFLDAARGDLRQVEVTTIGQQRVDVPGGSRIASRFHVESSRDFEVWYGLDGAWLGLSWSGFGVTAHYRLD